jgi:hypothetical protein
MNISINLSSDDRYTEGLASFNNICYRKEEKSDSQPLKGLRPSIK